MDDQASANALKLAGQSVHLHDGIWWLEVGPGFCKPVDLLRRMTPGTARPALLHRWMGYSHLVADAVKANWHWDVMYLEGDGLRQFDLARVKPKRRRRIKHALAALQVRRIEDIQPLLPAMNEINVITATRTSHGKPATYYVENRAEWERFMTHEFALQGREWWGAFFEGRLVAYYYSHVISRTLYINAAKSHTDFLNHGPNDALVFSLLEHHRNQADCDRIVYGDWSPDVPSLNEFKEQYGFAHVTLPVFRVQTPLMRLALQLKRRQTHEPKTAEATSGYDTETSPSSETATAKAA